SQFGTIVIFQISGLFAGSASFGWPATFWFCGILSLASFGLLAWLGAASPHEHPRVFVLFQKRSTPWRHIFTSKAVWALVATHAGSAAGYILVLTQMPTYMNHVLGVEIKKNGFLSSLPYVAMYFTALVFGWLADYTANKKLLSIVNIRRIANTTGMVLSGCCLIGFSYVTSTTPAINQIDLAPNFAGNIMALGNMVANLTSLLVPVVVSNVVRDDMVSGTI
ncbi:BmPI-T1, partial [Operophtera brumata]